MDRLDRDILSLLQRNNRLSTEQIGMEVGLSATACQRRIKKLRDSGYIQKEIAVLDSIKIGGYITVIVEVTMKQGGPTAIDQFRHQMMQRADVQQCYYVAGDHDFVLIITSANMLEYEKLSRELFFNNSNILRFKTTVALENVKVGLDIPLTDPE